MDSLAIKLGLSLPMNLPYGIGHGGADAYALPAREDYSAVRPLRRGLHMHAGVT